MLASFPAALLFSAFLANPVSASFAQNLNYRSPSLHHPSLGVSISKLTKRNNPSTFFPPSSLQFTHGVASGDPLHDSVILWTRVAPASDNGTSNSKAPVLGTAPLYDHDNQKYVQVSTAPVCVDWRISASKDPWEGTVADEGRVWTSSDVDWTVKVEAKGLRPWTGYYYQFRVCGAGGGKSPIGRTKTTPKKGEKVKERVKLAVYSCSNHPFGYFNAYRGPVEKQSVDFVVHLGDAIYEYAEGYYGYGYSLNRVPRPNKELTTLYDYRSRHGQYREDVDYQANMQSFAWIPVWDDHEVADNIWRDGSAELNNTEDSFVKDGGVSVDQRKANAVRAYFEWMPIRQVEMDDNLRIWRTVSVGDLLDLIMLDTRVYDRSITDLYWNTDYIHAISNDQGRTLMGSRQENWFFRQLIESQRRETAWRVIGNQIIFSRIDTTIASGPKNPRNYDTWEGYLGSKNRTLQTLYKHNITNSIFLSGDSHASWVSDLAWLDQYPYDPKTGQGAVGVEFAGSAVSSPSPAGENVTMAYANAASQWLVAANPELQWQDNYYRGYFELDIGYESVRAKYFGIPTTKTRSPREIGVAEFEVRSGENRLVRGKDAVVESGFIKFGERRTTNKTIDAHTGEEVAPWNSLSPGGWTGWEKEE